MAVDLEESIENYDLSYSGWLDHLQAIGLNKLFILGLILTLHLSRSSGFHLLQTYLPSFIFVLLGWLGLFIPRTSVPGRVGMGMTTILTLTAMLRLAIPPSPILSRFVCSGVRQNVPKVSYVSFLDVWMVTCLVFVNSCMFEFILVTALVNIGQEGLGDRVSKIAT